MLVQILNERDHWRLQCPRWRLLFVVRLVILIAASVTDAVLRWWILYVLNIVVWFHDRVLFKDR